MSEYTDKVDIAGLGWSKVKRIHEQLKALFSVICGAFPRVTMHLEGGCWARLHPALCTMYFIPTGLLVAEDFEAGKRALADSELESHALLFRGAFELARRYKILNPERMRDYGKLLHLLQAGSDRCMCQCLATSHGFQPLSTYTAPPPAAAAAATAGFTHRGGARAVGF